MLNPQEIEKIKEEFAEAYSDMPENFERVHSNYISDWWLSHINELLDTKVSQKLADELKVREERLVERIEKKEWKFDKTEEEKKLLTEIFGRYDDPEYLIERAYGYNIALKEIINLIQSEQF